MQTPESKLFEIAESQQGYFTFQQAIAAGFSNKNYAYHVKIGVLRSLTNTFNQKNEKPFIICDSVPDSKSGQSVKIYLGGSNDLGREQLVNKYIHPDYTYNIREKIDVHTVKKKSVCLADRNINVNIVRECDKARFHNFCESRYWKSDVILLMVDLDNRKSFDDLEFYFSSSMRDYLKDVPTILVGNKSYTDDAYRVIPAEAMVKVVSDHSFAGYIEVNGKSGDNVNKLFKRAAILGEEYLLRKKQPALPAPQVEAKVEGQKSKRSWRVLKLLSIINPFSRIKNLVSSLFKFVFYNKNAETYERLG